MNDNKTPSLPHDVTQPRSTSAHADSGADRGVWLQDKFLSTMNHELRNPLNAVLGFSELLSEERIGPLNERQRRYLNHIHNGGQQLLRLINDILDYSKLEAGRMQLAIDSVSVRAAAKEVLDALRPLAQKNSQSLSERLPDDLNVRADATRFKQVLQHLVTNAIKFSPEKATIEVVATDLGEFARIEVRDSGPGIPREEHARIFEAFYRVGAADQSQTGTGLGLAIAKKLIELQRGSLGLESEPGHGSSFYFTLPVVAAFPPSEISSGSPQTRGQRILVVEDNPEASELIQNHLAAAGFEVVLCDHSEKALTMAVDLQPSAVTLDVLLKPSTGWEVLTRLKSDSRTQHIPVIIISMIDQPSTGALLGADEYLVKPVQESALLSGVNRCLQHREHSVVKNSILVVEDDDASREYVAELLFKNGYSVDTAADGLEARKAVASSLPELVILDIMLPGVSGFELIAEWRGNPRTAAMPMFILTGKNLTDEEKGYLDSNSKVLIRKDSRWQEALSHQLEKQLFVRSTRILPRSLSRLRV